MATSVEDISAFLADPGSRVGCPPERLGPIVTLSADTPEELDALADIPILPLLRPEDVEQLPEGHVLRDPELLDVFAAEHRKRMLSRLGVGPVILDGVSDQILDGIGTPIMLELVATGVGVSELARRLMLTSEVVHAWFKHPTRFERFKAAKERGGWSCVEKAEKVLTDVDVNGINAKLDLDKASKLSHFYRWLAGRLARDQFGAQNNRPTGDAPAAGLNINIQLNTSQPDTDKRTIDLHPEPANRQSKHLTG